jgi:tetraacyldisaccharide 4'-kinase
MAQALPGISVLVGKDRYASGCYAYQQLGAQVVLLDDGFQHYRLARDLDIVLIDVTNPFGHGALLPRGILREPLYALQRADAVILARTELAREALPDVVAQIRTWNARVPIYPMRTVVQAVREGETVLGHDVVSHRRRVVAFVGIGNPQAFAMTLMQLGWEVAALLVFPDHHAYTEQDWQRVLALAARHQAACLVTTAKDVVRLSALWPSPIPLYTLCIDVVFPEGAEGLQQQLEALMLHADDCR